MTDLHLPETKRPERRMTAVLALSCALGLAGLSLLFAAVRMMTEAVTPDLPWILAAGHHIIATREIPAHDIFSWTHPDTPWLLYQWFFEVVMASGEALLGLEVMTQVLVLLMAVIYIFAPALYAHSCRVPLFRALLPGSLALMISTYNMSLRPMLLTTLFLLIQYLVVDRLARGRIGSLGAALAVALLYVVWSNMHMGLTLGLLSLSLCLLGDLFQRTGAYRFKSSDDGIDGPPLAAKVYLLLIAVAIGASLCNPYGPGIYFYLFDLSTKSGMNATINELQALGFDGFRPGLFLVLSGLVLLSFLRATRLYTARDALHLLVFALAAVFVGRFIVWALLFYALILPKGLHRGWLASGSRAGLLADLAEYLEARRRQVLAALAGLALVVVVAVPLWVQPFTLGGCTQLLPGIGTYLSQRQAGERLFNDSITGSCLLLAAPESEVFVDTRYDFYPPEFVLAVARALAAREGWQSFLEGWRPDALLMERSLPLASELRADSNYRVVFEDEHITLFRPVPD